MNVGCVRVRGCFEDRFMDWFLALSDGPLGFPGGRVLDGVGIAGFLFFLVRFISWLENKPTGGFN